MHEVILYIKVGWDLYSPWYSKPVEMPHPPMEGMYIYSAGRRVGPIRQVAWWVELKKHVALVELDVNVLTEEVMEYFDEHWVKVVGTPW